MVESLDTNGRAHADSLLLACLSSPPALLGICICMGFGNAINMRADRSVRPAATALALGPILTYCIVSAYGAFGEEMNNGYAP